MSGNNRGVTRRGRDGCRLSKSRVKRQEVQSEDGWTVITHGLSKVSLNAKDDNSKKKPAGLLPTETVSGLTLAKLHQEYDKLHQQWSDMSVDAQIAELSESKRWVVDTAVAIGIGSFSRDWEHRWRSLWQLVLFEEIVQHLSKNGVRMYAQDPAFNSLDIDFLDTHGITTMSSGIETHIAEKTFVYAPFVDWYILLPVFLRARDPVVYVGNEVLEDYEMYAGSRDKKELARCNEIGRGFLRAREGLKIREFEGHGSALEGMRWYWKKTTDVIEGENGNGNGKEDVVKQEAPA